MASGSHGGSLDAHMQWWWDTKASATFSHREYSAFGGLATLIKSQCKAWVQRFCADGRCHGARVIDYGIGAGSFGVHALDVYNASHYDGIDISTRSLDAARSTLAQHFHANRFALHNTSVDFATLRPDVFVTQAVIQHFPSYNYTINFLERVNRCGARYLMLMTRNGTMDRHNEVVGNVGGRHAEWRIKYAVRILTSDLERVLDAYALEWTFGNRSTYDNIYHSFRRRDIGMDSLPSWHPTPCSMHMVSVLPPAPEEDKRLRSQQRLNDGGPG